MSDQSKKTNHRQVASEDSPASSNLPRESKFEVWGQEMIEREVKRSGNSGRIYLPPNWINRRVKVIRID